MSIKCNPGGVTRPALEQIFLETTWAQSTLFPDHLDMHANRQARWSAGSYTAASLGRDDSGHGFRWLFFKRSPAVSAAERGSDCDGELRRSPRMARLEAVLFVAEGALSTRKLAQFATLADAAEATQLIQQLNVAYDRTGSAFRIERVATGYQLLTRPGFSSWLDKLYQRPSTLKLSAPAMETLTIVAYRQPITRADVDAVRGVQSAEMLKLLMERSLVRIAGEEETLGRPYLYETTPSFLEQFGLRTLDDLPMADRLRESPAPGIRNRGGGASGDDRSSGK